MEEYVPEILSVAYVKEHGVLYDETVFYSDDYECGALYDKDPALGGKPFSGLLYELYPNENLRYYQVYQNGYGKGAYVTFYPDGFLCSYSIMERFAFVGKSYTWYKNGRIKEILERKGQSVYYSKLQYDEEGNQIS